MDALIKEERLEFSAPLGSNGYTLNMEPGRLGRLKPVPESERRDFAALHKRLDEQGYLYLKQFFAAAKINQFREYYFKMLAETGLVAAGSDPVEGLAGSGPVDQVKAHDIIFNDIVRGKEYEALCTSPELVEFFEGFFGGQVFLHKRKIIRHVRAGGGQSTGAHYDLVYLREGTDQVLTAWIPLGDCRVEDGALIYLEGSHKIIREMDKQAVRKIQAEWLTRDLPALADKFDCRWLAADYRAGDLVIHTAYTVHASVDNTNQAGRMRLSTDIRYQLAEAPVDARWQNHWHDRDGL
jgi:ectoine hydroxylase-related dioxygenase (phytanoyl-CoA dioxygenase family)